MNLNLKGKKVFITGSSKGIGLEIARSFLEENCEVIINGRNRKNLLLTKKKLIKVKIIIGDVTKKKISKNIAKKISKINGGIDILVCNVGSGLVNKKLNTLEGDWEESFTKNFFSATNIIESFKNNIIKNKGVIVCISSICGNENIPGAPFSYSIAKSALNNYVKHLSKKFGKHKVRINAISPGNILHKGSVWQKKIKKNSKKIKKFLNEEVALKKLGKPEDIASLAVFLSSNKAKFITGSVIVVDGGQIRSA